MVPGADAVVCGVGRDRSAPCPDVPRRLPQPGGALLFGESGRGQARAAGSRVRERGAPAATGAAVRGGTGRDGRRAAGTADLLTDRDRPSASAAPPPDGRAYMRAYVRACTVAREGAALLTERGPWNHRAINAA
ncbi:hypothetical protein GCM10010343_76190 [Streptomyces avidinii]|nr:hypothetical protein GCM10010343_76190 [Streptomyces avidinii]